MISVYYYPGGIPAAGPVTFVSRFFSIRLQQGAGRYPRFIFNESLINPTHGICLSLDGVVFHGYQFNRSDHGSQGRKGTPITAKDHAGG